MSIKKIKAAGGNQTAFKTTSFISNTNKINSFGKQVASNYPTFLSCKTEAYSGIHGENRVAANPMLIGGAIMAIKIRKKTIAAIFTRITATKPDIVTKEFSLNSEGDLNKVTTAHVSDGTMETVNVRNLKEFSYILQSLSSNQCLAYGVTGHDKVNLMTEKSWKVAGCPSDSLPRSSKNMTWGNHPGILMLDYDPPKDGNIKPLTQEELVAKLIEACPGLQEVEMLWWPSTSSNIYLGDKELAGVKGQRIYILVKKASDIPRLGKAINTLLWANGTGYFEVRSCLAKNTLFII